MSRITKTAEKNDCNCTVQEIELLLVKIIFPASLFRSFHVAHTLRNISQNCFTPIYVTHSVVVQYFDTLKDNCLVLNVTGWSDKRSIRWLREHTKLRRTGKNHR